MTGRVLPALVTVSLCQVSTVMKYCKTEVFSVVDLGHDNYNLLSLYRVYPVSVMFIFVLFFICICYSSIMSRVCCDCYVYNKSINQ